MAEITNFNRYRKAKTRAEDRRLAEENAARFGRSKTQKQADADAADRAARRLDQHRRDDDG